MYKALGPGNWSVHSEHVNAGGNSYVALIPEGHPTAEPNARLIAATPDLLAALKRLLQETWSADRIFGDEHGESMCANSTWANARAAIAKAEGELYHSTCWKCGKHNRIVNECGCDKNNLPTRINKP